MIASLSVVQLAQAVGLAFGLGVLLLLALSALPVTRPIARQLWVLLGSEAVILAAGVLPWFLPPAGLLACVLAMAVRVGFESGTVYSLITGRSLGWICAGALVIGSTAAWFSDTEPLLWVLAAMTAMAVAAMSLTAGASLVGNLGRFAIFPLLPVMAFSHTAGQSHLVPLLVLAFLLVEVFDSFSLLGGRLYGRTPLAQRLSPRKTWEGLFTGAAALFTVVLALVFSFSLPFGPMILGGLLVLGCAISGDLLASLAKRRAGVKDYPPVMTVQGGLLDIMDAWLVAGPCLAALAWVTGLA